MIEQAKFNYAPLGKAFEKQTKTIKDQAEKNADALKALKPKELKPKELKEKEAEPIEYDNHFINGLAEIQKSTKPIDRDENLYFSRQ